jgi:hypothetical protein
MHCKMRWTILAAILTGVVRASGVHHAAAQCVPEIYKFEVTQSTQKFEVVPDVHLDDNTLPLLENRFTTVRAYLRGCPAGGWIKYTGRLRVLHGTQEIHSRRADKAISMPPYPANREVEDHTLNFTFIPWGATGNRTLTMVACVWPAGQPESCEQTLTRSFDFNLRRAPTFQGLKMNYTFPPDPYDPTYGQPALGLIAPHVGDAMLWAIYPFPEPGATGYTLANRPALPWPQDVNLTVGLLLRTLAELRPCLRPAPDHLYAWFKGRAVLDNGWGQEPGTAAFGNTEQPRYQRTFAHEEGHNFGYSHRTWFATQIDEVGWDVLHRLSSFHTTGRVRPDELVDIMVPGKLTREAWIHTGNWLQTYSEQTEPVSATPLNVLVIPVVADEASWQLGHPTQCSSLGTPLQPVSQGLGEVRILDAQNNLLYSTHFSGLAQADAPGVPAQEVGGALAVPYSAAAHRIELLRDGVLQDTRTRSPNAPAVAITNPAPGSTLHEGTLIQWQASDADGGTLQAMVVYTHDSGQTLIPLAVGLEAGEWVLETDRLPMGSNVSVRVVVSDGFNTGTAEVTGLQFGTNRAPEAYIYSPQDGAQFFYGANVPLLGSASDAEDGELPTSAMRWYSDLDGLLGTGPALNASMSLGSHTIEFRVTDSVGATTSAFVNTSVDPVN